MRTGRNMPGSHSTLGPGQSVHIKSFHYTPGHSTPGPEIRFHSLHKGERNQIDLQVNKKETLTYFRFLPFSFCIHLFDYTSVGTGTGADCSFFFPEAK